MIKIKDIVISSVAPNLKEVGWLRPIEGNRFELCFFGNNGWEPIFANTSFSEVTPGNLILEYIEDVSDIIISN